MTFFFFFARFSEPGCARAMTRLTRYPVKSELIQMISQPGPSSLGPHALHLWCTYPDVLGDYVPPGINIYALK